MSVAGKLRCRVFDLMADEWFDSAIDFSYTVTEDCFYIAVGKTKPGTKYPIEIPDGDYFYTINTILKPNLTSMTIADNDTMSPSFAWNQHEYTAYVPEEQETATIICESAVRNGRNEPQITYNDGENKEIPVIWNSDDEMDINIHLANATDSSDYTIHLKKEPNNDIPAYILQPKDASYFDVDSAEELTVRATANADVTYQWYKSESGKYEDGVAIEGAATDSYTPEIVNIGELQEVKYYYYCRAISVKGDEYYANSEIAVITVKPDPTPYDIVVTEEDGSPIPEEGYVYKEGDDSVVLTISAKSRAKGGEWKYLWTTRTGDQISINAYSNSNEYNIANQNPKSTRITTAQSPQIIYSSTIVRLWN